MVEEFRYKDKLSAEKYLADLQAEHPGKYRLVQIKKLEYVREIEKIEVDPTCSENGH